MGSPHDSLVTKCLDPLKSRETPLRGISLQKTMSITG